MNGLHVLNLKVRMFNAKLSSLKTPNNNKYIYACSPGNQLNIESLLKMLLYWTKHVDNKTDMLLSRKRLTIL